MAIDVSRSASARTSTRRRAVREQEVVPIGDGTWEMRRHGKTIGFVWPAGPVWVALTGPTQSTACEVGQSLIWDVAVRYVEETHRGLREA